MMEVKLSSAEAKENNKGVARLSHSGNGIWWNEDQAILL